MLLDLANGIDLIRIIHTAVEELSSSIRRGTARICLTINTTKTYDMIAGRDRGMPNAMVLVLK